MGIFDKVNDLDFLNEISIESQNNENINTNLKLGTIEENELSSDQLHAIETVTNWWNNERFYKPVEVVAGAGGTGKCLQSDTYVITPAGLKQIKDLTLDDKVFGADGKPYNITGIFPQAEKKVCYKIKFTDNTSFICDEEQILRYSYNNINFYENTLATIFKERGKDEKLYFPINKPVFFEKKKTALPIVTMGVLYSLYCSDYDFNGMYFTIYFGNDYNDYILKYLKKELKENGYQFLDARSDMIEFQMFDEEKANNFKQHILSLPKNHIPDEIIYNDFITRREFLRGFLCAYGDIKHCNDIRTFVPNEQKYKDIKFLVETLGGLTYEDIKYDKRFYCAMKIVLGKNISTVPSSNYIKEVKDIIKLDTPQDTICIKIDNPKELYLIQDCIIVHNTTIIPHIINRLNLGEQIGHALHEDTGVLTQQGFIPIKNIKVDDEVCGADGKFYKVTGVYPQGKRKMYKVYFSDGKMIRCDEEHIWTVSSHLEGYENFTLKTILEKGLYTTQTSPKFKVPLVKPVNFSTKKLPIHPYLLAVIITSRVFDKKDTIRLTLKHYENLDYISELLKEINYKVSFVRENKKSIVVDFIPTNTTIQDGALLKELNKLNICDLKKGTLFIPPIYLMGDIKQRRQLLNGLIDNAGILDHKSDLARLSANKTLYFSVEFISASEQLEKDIVFLTESLGGLGSYHILPALKEKYGESLYKLSIKILPHGMEIRSHEFDRCDIFKLNKFYRKIATVEEDEEAEAICISVDAPYGLFVIDHFVVTHNTTISNQVAFGAFTGKATMRLREKGVPAETIHHLCYIPKVNKRTKEITFEKRKRLPDNIKLILVDEFSMIGEKLMEDLQSFNVPILMFGDPFQLQPVKDLANPYLNKIDVLMTEIHRQAANNPIIRLSKDIRENKPIKPCDYSALKVILKSQVSPEQLKEYALNCDQILCGKNITRNMLNDSYRVNLGRTSLKPQIGDKIICLKNNPRKVLMNFPLVNGMIGTISDLGINAYGKPTLDFIPDFLDLPFTNLIYDEKVFLRINNNKEKYKHKIFDEFDYGYAITVHKSQGSEWDKVLVCAENMPNLNQWLYTAVTRAKKELILIL